MAYFAWLGIILRYIFEYTTYDMAGALNMIQQPHPKWHTPYLVHSLGIRSEHLFFEKKKIFHYDQRSRVATSLLSFEWFSRSQADTEDLRRRWKC